MADILLYISFLRVYSVYIRLYIGSFVQAVTEVAYAPRLGLRPVGDAPLLSAGRLADAYRKHKSRKHQKNRYCLRHIVGSL